ncbi:MAG: DUF2975 domain-containing protein [Acutalibacteraceae bacterium]|nr:DUF2975 domain-containing protein [Acutalibacteraceae bacterium]
MKKSKSIFASMWVVRIIILLMATSAFFMPTVGSYYNQLANHGVDITFPITIGLYILLIPAMATMVALHFLLNNIKKGNMFDKQNIAYLTLISVGLFIIGAICLGIATFSWVFSLISAAFLFVAVILLVVKNVFKQAVNIKEENDFTI